MEDIENKIYKTLTENSICFLRDAIERLVSNDNDQSDKISHDLLVLTCTSLQISLELALKAYLIKQLGIKSILNNDQKDLSSTQIEELIENNRLKTISFEAIKNYSKSKSIVSNLTEDDYTIIDDFQRYRNKMVHFYYIFFENDYYDLKYDVVHYLIHVLSKIYMDRADLNPSEILESILGSKHFKLITKYQPYIDAMNRLATYFPRFQHDVKSQLT